MWPLSKKTTYTLTPTQELLLALLRAQLWLKPVDDIVLPGCNGRVELSEAVSSGMHSQSEGCECSSMTGNKNDTDEDVLQQWNDLLNLGYKQTVVCFIAAACLRHKDVNNIPADIREELAAVIEENAKIHEQHNAILIELITKFEVQGLHPILLKGQGLAQMYDCVLDEEVKDDVPDGTPALNREGWGGSNSLLRQCGDIDLYFRQEEYEQAEAYIKTIEDDNDEHVINYNHYETHYKGMSVEVHKHTSRLPNPFANKRLQEFASEEMKHPDTIQINGKEVNIPSPMYNIISVFAHMWHHFEDRGVSLRQMCDVAMMIRYYGLGENEAKVERTELKRILNKISHLKFWKISGCVFVKYLGLPKECFSQYDESYSHRADIMLNLVLTDGAFNFEPKIEIGKGLISQCKLRWKRQVRTHRTMMHVYPVSGYSIFWRYAQVKKWTVYRILKFIAER